MWGVTVSLFASQGIFPFLVPVFLHAKWMDSDDVFVSETKEEATFLCACMLEFVMQNTLIAASNTPIVTCSPSHLVTISRFQTILNVYNALIFFIKAFCTTQKTLRTWMF
jgi:hypothetical protein